jgi:hypothetical protein
MRCKDGSIIYIRQATEPNEKQKEIYKALNIDYQAGEIRHAYI